MNAFPRYSMHIFQVSAKVTALCKGLLTKWTLEWSQASVLSEMISQIAALLKDASTIGVFALEI